MPSLRFGSGVLEGALVRMRATLVATAMAGSGVASGMLQEARSKLIPMIKAIFFMVHRHFLKVSRSYVAIIAPEVYANTHKIECQEERQHDQVFGGSDR
jgi:hypothetical protein